MINEEYLDRVDDKIINIAQSFAFGFSDKETAKRLFMKQSLIYRDYLEAIGHPDIPSLEQATQDLEESFEIVWEQK